MGTLKLLKQEGVNYDEALESVAETIVAVAEDKLFKGYIYWQTRRKPAFLHCRSV